MRRYNGVTKVERNGEMEKSPWRRSGTGFEFAELEESGEI